MRIYIPCFPYHSTFFFFNRSGVESEAGARGQRVTARAVILRTCDRKEVGDEEEGTKPRAGTEEADWLVAGGSGSEGGGGLGRN